MKGQKRQKEKLIENNDIVERAVRAKSRDMSESSLGIEENSMKIIESELGTHDYNEQQWNVVRRVIHATADFDFAKPDKNGIIFSTNAIENAFEAFRKKRHIVVDVDMVQSGINKKSVSKIGNSLVCNISNKEVIETSKNENKTRSTVAMRYSSKEIDGGVVVIGNAPTALYEVIKMINENVVKPALVIGIPVGFVSAAESKSELLKTNVEFITNIGRKGGSPAASSIINALMLLYISNLN
ncbi:MAG TPA: precorrin-8X methylmutase [Nitrososphaeraceae archaeon]|nr:precorrin-8X methylmutase [Nitrososphaeraceae archaeon]